MLPILSLALSLAVTQLVLATELPPVAPVPAADAPARPKSVYRTHCAGCHGVEALTSASMRALFADAERRTPVQALASVGHGLPSTCDGSAAEKETCRKRGQQTAPRPAPTAMPWAGPVPTSFLR